MAQTELRHDRIRSWLLFTVDARALAGPGNERAAHAHAQRSERARRCRDLRQLPDHELHLSLGHLQLQASRTAKTAPTANRDSRLSFSLAKSHSNSLFRLASASLFLFPPFPSPELLAAAPAGPWRRPGHPAGQPDSVREGPDGAPQGQRLHLPPAAVGRLEQRRKVAHKHAERSQGDSDQKAKGK